MRISSVVLLSAILAAVFAQDVILAASGTINNIVVVGTTNKFPVVITTAAGVVSTVSNVNAKPIWDSTSTTACAASITVKSSFTSYCPGGALTLEFVGQGSVTYQINSEAASAAVDATTVQTATPTLTTPLTCGTSNTITFTITGSGSCPRFFTYSLKQDITSCNTCTYPQSFVAPICGCGCANHNPNAVAPTGWTWNDANCAYECTTPPTTCATNFFPNADTCSCQCLRPSCQPGFRVSNCACVKCKTTVPTCTGSLVWNDSTCSCLASCSAVTCTAPQVPVATTTSCTCKCPVVYSCGRGGVWDDASCSCSNDNNWISNNSGKSHR